MYFKQLCLYIVNTLVIMVINNNNIIRIYFYNLVFTTST